jgi:nickel-dependent lactate racemase
LVEVWLPYGRSEIPVRVPEERLIDIFKVESGNPLPDPGAEATKLLASNESFLQKASQASRICVVLGSCGDGQLAVDLATAVLKAINNPQASTVVLSTRESPELDPNSIESGQVLRHTAKSETVDLGATKNGLIPQVNSEFVRADLRILVGELRPHQFLRYAGLCDLVFPLLGSEPSIEAHLSHWSGLSLDGLHEERIEVAKSFENVFMLGLALDADLRPTTIVFGGIDNCLGTLEPIVDERCTRRVSKRSDIVVMSAGGAPFDATLDLAVETLPAGLNVLKKDGALIIAAECQGGHGGGQFYEWSAEHKEPRYLESRLRRKFSYQGFKASFLKRTLQTHRLYLVSTIPDHYVESVFGIRPSQTVNAALQTAQRALGADSTISVIPNACRVTPKLIEAGSHG